ncbi:unnamed protein product [Arctia plantaginis]|uniref:DOMON domain-containing protein n=1 Tax=Arctia plantaginis TaxID=874455 RepID=A0A8S0ZMA2_ARCPL|nr:unnamed protein product [Arctia plantaginis]
MKRGGKASLSCQGRPALSPELRPNCTLECNTRDTKSLCTPTHLMEDVACVFKYVSSKLNCEVLYDDLAFEVRWAVAGDSIVVQLVAKLEDGEYMSFGISGNAKHSQMVGGDVAVAWVDKSTLKGYAVDYYLDAKSQCAGVRGSCPDERLVENTNSIRLLNAALVNGYSIVTYQRSLRAADELDRAVLTNASQPIIWAIGPLNSRNEVSYHSHFTRGDKLLEFGRPPMWNCPMPEEDDDKSGAGVEASHHHHDHAHEHSHDHAHDYAHDHMHDHKHGHKHTNKHQSAVIKPNPVPTPAPVPRVVPWSIPAIQCYEPPDGVFYAQMGPTGGKQGYSAITGHVGWGISWYINGLLIPEINVVRGRKYTFVVEGGYDPDVPARYHPFYITNDPVGGYFHKTDAEKQGIKIYAGVRQTRNGNVTPIGVGRLCNWTPDPKGPEADEYLSFGAYQRALTLVCEEGNPGVVTWIPDRKTPDTVYYQCFTHRHLGWKINVLDECDVEEGVESRIVERVVAPPDDMVSMESIQVHTRVTPDKNFINERKKAQKIINTKTNYDNFSSFKGSSGLTGEVYPDSEGPYGQEFELPISNGQIEDVIRTVETLEHKMKDDLKRNATQYQVTEDVKEMFLPEQPIREDDEYSIDSPKIPQNYFLPSNQKPLTLQSVLHPNGHNKPVGHMRPPFRRPVPPEIKLRRPPPPGYQKGTYPLPMPNHHNMYGPAKKPPSKIVPNRLPSNVNRPPSTMERPPPTMDRPPLSINRGTSTPPLKTMHAQHPSKSKYNQITKLVSKKNQSTPLSHLQTIIMGKPSMIQPTLPLPPQSQKVNLGQSDIIASHVVKSQIMLPGANDAVAQQSIKQTYINVPGQIILGKPMDNPMPLDQQMMQTKQYGLQTSSTPLPAHVQSTQRIHMNPDHNQTLQNEMKSSDFIGESADAFLIQPAVNTGFKPDSIVVESGFKPIIREPLMAGEDRITDEYETLGSNRREDTDIQEDYEEPAQIVSSKHKYPSDQLTETFEPMFIPSPEDHLLSTNDRTKEIFPPNHAKEDRPHPVYVKTKNELNAIFNKKNLEKDISTDLVMEPDRISPHYLPPDPKLPKEHYQKLSNQETFTTYDGKTVSGATLTSVPEAKPPKLFSAKLPANTKELLKTPQFGPFKGEIPPPVEAHITLDEKSNINVRMTNLKLVDEQKPKNVSDHDLNTTTSSSVMTQLNATEHPDEYEEVEEYEEDQVDEDLKKRVKRDTNDTTFDLRQTNGHSKPINQADFEILRSTGTTSNTRISGMTHIVLLAICMKLL